MNVLLRRAERVSQLTRALGPTWLLQRAGYALQLRSGWIQKKLPATAWTAQPLANALSDAALAEPAAYLDYRRAKAPRFFFAPGDREKYATQLKQWDGERNPVAEIEQFMRGQFTYFNRTVGEVGFPPAWNANPFTGKSTPSDRHWSRIGDFGHGDIKIVWEPNRFGFAYTLVRAYWRTGDEGYAEQFWQLIEDWQTHNPPQQGVNWKCGQEASLRVMAWCFGLYGFLNSAATTAARVAMLAQMIALSGQRIAANLNYALSQRNNHGISEGLGLWTIGVLFPELSQAAKWRETGRRVLEAEGRDLVYDDGSFAQHSVVYHRLMLHDYLWALRLGDVLEQPFSAELKSRIGKAGEFLYQIQDETSGQVPLYGQTDGALILPLNNCGYPDFRPVIQAIHYLSNGTRCYESGAWDEDLLWLFGADALISPIKATPREDLAAKVGGYYILRSPQGFAFTRCVSSFRHRPGQADVLHVDIWWRGQNVACDSGTYSYNAPDPWNNSFGQTSYHNTITVDGKNQMEQAGKFLWLPWLQGRVRFSARSEAGALDYWEGEHNGYERLAAPTSHRRAVVRLGDEHWLIMDAVRSAESHDFRLHWLLPDGPHQWNESGQIALTTPAGDYHVQAATMTGEASYSLVRADENSPRGWRSPFYGYREAALSLDVTQKSSECKFWTILGPQSCQVKVSAGVMKIEAATWQATVQCGTRADEPMVTSVEMRGDTRDKLEIR